MERVVISENEVIEGVKEVWREAMANERHAAANKSLELLGKYLGLWDGRRKGDDELEDQTDEELQAALIAGKEILERIEGNGDPAPREDREGTRESEAS